MTLRYQLDTRTRKDGRAMVRLCISDGGVQLRHELDMWVRPEQWDRGARRVLFGKHKLAAAYNEILVRTIGEAEVLATQHPGITPGELRNLLRRTGEGRMSFVELARLDLNETPPKSWHTRRQRNSVLKAFEQFDRYVTVERMDSVLMERYKAHVLATGVTHNTMAWRLGVISTMYRRCCKRLKIRPDDILDGVDAVERYSDPPEQCTPEEVRRLYDYALVSPGWKGKAVCMWLFSEAHAGVRWGDLCCLKVDNVRDGRFKLVANKVDRGRDIPLVERIKVLTELHRCGDYLFGIAGDQEPTAKRIASANATANRYLKVAAKACGIKRRLHTHNARHSFAARAFRSGVHDRLTQAMMDLSDSAYKHYRARFNRQDVDDAFHTVDEAAGSRRP